MRNSLKISLLAVAATATLAATPGFARQGADDPAGHVRQGRGADDAAGDVRRGRGADDAAGDVRQSRGADDAGKAADDRGRGQGRGRDDAAGH